MHPFHRTELLLGSEGFERLRGASVCVVGLGGVGGHAAEALARSGVGHLTIVDFDRVCLTNLNRQVHALRSTVGESKAELMAARLKDVNPKLDLRALPLFYAPDVRDEVLDRPYDAVIDAIDNMATKLDLLETCVRRGLPVWSAMGAGGRLDPTRVRVTDLADTNTDPFARIVRKNLRERGIERGVGCVWSDEPPNDLDAAVQAGFRCICPDKADSPNSCDRRFQVQGTVAWMPAVFGMTLAAAVVHHLVGRPLGARPAPKPAASDGLALLQPVSRQAF
jgi:tRNA A37 threonylcarbamoyladenosine dehydratase